MEDLSEMSREVVILITGVGSGVAQSVIKALKYANMQSDRGYYLIGTDANWKAAGLYVVDKGYLVPYCDNPKYLDRLIDICNQNDVTFVIPGTDPEVKVLCDSKEFIEENTCAHVLVNPSSTVEIGFDKYKTSQFLKDNNFPSPWTISISRETLKDLSRLDFPCIVKPRYGSGSVGLALIKNHKMLENHLETFDMEMIAQEYIDAVDNEFTCGLLFNKDKELLQTIIMKRDLKKGFTAFAQVAQNAKIDSLIREIAQVLKGRGSYNIQGRLHGDEFIVFEINPRFSGTTAFRAVAGLNEPDLYIQNYLYGVLPETISIRDLCMSRYLNECYFTCKQGLDFETTGRLDNPEGFIVNYF